MRIQDLATTPGGLFTGTEPCRVLKVSEIDLNPRACSRDSPEVDATLAFSRWLRANDDDRALYQPTRLELGRQHSNTIQKYAEAESEVIAQILQRAITDT